MTDDINLTHDASFEAFDGASGVVSTTDDDGVTFSWDEEHVVRVDAPSDLKGAFDTERFYKIEDATVARPIKQPYMVGDGIEWYKKPAEELQKAAWSFDNAPFTLGHPDTGMVKDVNDVHGFWRNVSYNNDDERMLADLYVPVNDDEAKQWIEEHTDVSPGFYNRVRADYDGDTGDLTDDEGLDGFQVDMYGNHIAGVERGRCSGEDGCGLDDQNHGEVFNEDTHVTTDEAHDLDYSIAPPTADYTEDGTYYAVAPDENPDGEPKFPINSCSDVEDAWKLRGHGDIDISQSTLEDRIKSKARDLGCDVPGENEESSDSQDPESTEDCGCTENMTDNETEDESFDVPDLSVDAVAEKNDAVAEVVEERDSLREDLDEAYSTIEEAFDSAEHFSVELDEDECPCEAVDDLVEDLDEKAEKVERLEDELSEYREDEIEEKLDRLESLGADRDEWEDEGLDALDEEIERREEIAEELDAETSIKDVDASTDSDETESNNDTDISGRRQFGRGHSA